MRLNALPAALLFLMCCAAPAHAQAVRLRFHDGLVSLTTQNAPLRAILAEWSRLAGATITNAERVSGAPLTLELNDVPERQALDVLLRNVSGYLAATRPATKPGVSVYDRILILPTSSAPRNPTPTSAPSFQPRPAPLPQPQVIDPTVTDEDDNDQPQARPGRVPFGQPQPQQEPPDEQPEQPATTPTPANPFGIPSGATSRPGVVTPVPQQQPQRTQPDPEP